MTRAFRGPEAGLAFLVEPLALRPGVARSVLDDGAVVLADDDRVVVFDGAVERRLLPLIDGARSGRQLAAAMDGPGTNLSVVEALLRLQSAGWIRVVSPCFRVAVLAVGSVDFRWIGAAIEASSDLALESTTAAAELTLVVARDYLDPEVEEVVGRADGPICLVRPGRQVDWIGPILERGSTACWHCLAHRLRRHREGHVLLEREREAPAPSGRAADRWSAALLAEQLAGFARRKKGHPLRGALVSVDAGDLSASRHTVTRRPQCPRCGDPKMEEPAPIRLGSRTRTGDGEAGFRALDPQALLCAYARQVSPITGIARGIWTVGDADAVHVARAPHIPSRPADDWKELRARGRGAAGGKGTTRLQARASALGEALERYSSCWQGTEPTMEASYTELVDRGEPVLHPGHCMLFSDAQYTNRRAINESGLSSKQFVPERFDETRPIRWSRVWSLSRERWTWLPSSYVYMGAPQEPDHHCIVGESNGNAAGACIEDAVLQGFLELVERDSVALWWYNALLRPGVVLEGVDDAYMEPLGKHFAELGREFWVLDLTADLAVPAFVCVSRALGDGPDEVTMGFGAHVDARIGILRAVAEMNQLMPRALREVERSDRLPEDLQRDGTSFRLRVEDAQYLRPDPDQPARALADFAPVESDDLGAIARSCQRRVEEAGLEMLAHDLTRPDVGMPVVKVIVPGMRHFWPRFAPGRLYDVPVAMGWRREPLAEDDLNPIILNG